MKYHDRNAKLMKKVLYLTAGPENIEGLLIVNALIKSQTVCE